MRKKDVSQTLTFTSPSAAGTTIAASVFRGTMFQQADTLVVDAVLRGATGGTLDVYLQRKVASDTWADLAHWPQQASGGAAKRYTFTITDGSSTIVETGGGTDASPGVALAANTAVNVMPGGDVRVVFVAGVGTSAGASQTITITPYVDRT